MAVLIFISWGIGAVRDTYFVYILEDVLHIFLTGHCPPKKKCGVMPYNNAAIMVHWILKCAMR